MNFNRRLIFLLLLSLTVTGCLESYPRKPLPSHLVESANVAECRAPIRFWGDEFSSAFNNTVTAKDEQIRASAISGLQSSHLKAADYLSISGGGDQGAFTAGFLKGWTDSHLRPTFEVVTGVSAGALAAPFAFLGSDYDDALRRIYTELGADDLFSSRGARAYYSDALNDTSPLRNVISAYVTDEFLNKIKREYERGRRIFVLTTNMDAQRPVVWDLTAVAASGCTKRRELFADVLLASSAIPGIFPPVRISVTANDGASYEELHADGGATAELIFVPPEMRLLAVEKQVFGQLRDRRLYIIRNGKLTPEYEFVDARTITLAARGVATLVKYQVISDLNRLERIAHENSTALYYTAIPPTFNAPRTREFDINYSKSLYELGLQMGKQRNWSTTPPQSPELVVK